MKLYLLPLILCILLLSAIFISYSISVSLNHVSAFLPYISDAGVLVPERSIFSQLINIAVILQIALAYVRFDQVTTLDENYHRNRCLSMINRLSFWVGIFVSMGLSLIGNFQLNDDKNNGSNPADAHNNYSGLMEKVHWTGAFFAFVGGIFWMFLQSIITQKTRISSEDKKRHRCRMILRYAISVTCLIFLLSGIGLALVAATDGETMDLSGNDYHSAETHRGRISLTAAFCEWIIALLVVAFTFTFCTEFREFRLVKAKVVKERDFLMRKELKKEVETTLIDISSS